MRQRQEDERASHRRNSDPRWPRVMRRSRQRPGEASIGESETAQRLYSSAAAVDSRANTLTSSELQLWPARMQVRTNDLLLCSSRLRGICSRMQLRVVVCAPISTSGPAIPRSGPATRTFGPAISRSRPANGLERAESSLAGAAGDSFLANLLRDEARRREQRESRCLRTCFCTT